MPQSLAQSHTEALLNSVRKASPAKANLNVNFVHNGARLLRLAVIRTGLNHKEAMDALGVEHKSEFSEMLDGKRKLWVHQLLRPEAAAIWKELIFLSAKECGCRIKHVIETEESA